MKLFLTNRNHVDIIEKYEKLGDSMLLNLSKILSTPSRKEDFIVPLELDTIAFGKTYPVVEKEDVKVTAENIGRNKMHIEVSTKLTLSLSCDRCLTEVLWECPIQVETDYDKTDSDDEWNQERFIEGNNLDVERLICEELLPKIPMKVLCKEDCKGICPVCGANRNEEDCGCDQTVPDPRMAAIQDIFNKSIN